MIVGKGLIASALCGEGVSGDSIIAFASGVSNSKEINAIEYQREKLLLEQTLKDGKIFLYFSTCSIYDESLNNSPYVQHKKEMEELVRKNSSDYFIFRLPQMVGNTKNSKTLVRYLYEKISVGESFEIQRNAVRNIIDVADMAKIVKKLLDSSWSCRTINIANTVGTTVFDIVKYLENSLGLKARYKTVAGGSNYKIETSECALIADKLGIQLGINYPESVIKKYYDCRK